MNHLYIAAIGILASSSSLSAQTLNSGSATPVPGDQFSFSSAEFVQPGAGGAAQTWDYSGVTLSSPGSNTWIAPSATGLTSTFPNATVALQAGASDYIFYRGTASTYEDDGFFTGGYTGTCSDRLIMMQYPFSFGNSFTDNSTCSVTYGTTWSRTTDITVTADGYGDVITPNGTITNVLRVHSVKHMIDNQYNPASVYDNDSYSFYKPGVHGPVVVLDRSFVTLFGFTLLDSTTSVMEGGSIGFEEAMRHDIGVDVQPNPTNERLEILFSTAGGHQLSIDVIDLRGTVVMRNNFGSQVSGVQREVLDVRGLVAGAYLVRVTDESGATGMRRFVRL